MKTMGSVRNNKFSWARLMLILLTILSSLYPFPPFPFSPARAIAQEVVDRMVAIVNGRELITYTDLLWQLALQPDAPLDNPRLDDLRRALDLLIDQRLITQEAQKLPSAAPTEKEINDEITAIIKNFPSRAAFFERLNRVGLGEDSTQFREIVQERVRIQKYLDFRFRSFTVVTPQEIETYYRDVFVPRRRRQSPGQIVPELKDVTNELKNELIERKIASDIDEFLEEARTAAQVTYLDERLKSGG
jgi:hypothetical protein